MATLSTAFPFRQNIGFLLSLVSHYKDQQVARCFAAAPLTAAQFRVLFSIDRGVNSQARIGQLLMMDVGALSRMVERLVQRDLLARSPDPHDRRRMILALTAHGEAVYRELEHRLTAVLTTQLTRQLSEEEYRLLCQLLVKLLPDAHLACVEADTAKKAE